jgi:hypothetical protein
VLDALVLSLFIAFSLSLSPSPKAQEVVSLEVRPFSSRNSWGPCISSKLSAFVFITNIDAILLMSDAVTFVISGNIPQCAAMKRILRRTSADVGWAQILAELSSKVLSKYMGKSAN